MLLFLLPRSDFYPKASRRSIGTTKLREATPGRSCDVVVSIPDFDSSQSNGRDVIFHIFWQPGFDSQHDQANPLLASVAYFLIALLFVFGVDITHLIVVTEMK